MRVIVSLLAFVALSILANMMMPQKAADQGTEHAPQPTNTAMQDVEQSTSTAMQDMMTAMDTMMRAMPSQSTSMVDADFLLMMIPHHQLVIDMARVELERGDDEAIRSMAQQIIDSQEAEIAEMRAMLDGMGVEAPVAPAE